MSLGVVIIFIIFIIIFLHWCSSYDVWSLWTSQNFGQWYTNLCRRPRFLFTINVKMISFTVDIQFVVMSVQFW